MSSTTHHQVRLVTCIPRFSVGDEKKFFYDEYNRELLFIEKDQLTIIPLLSKHDSRVMKFASKKLKPRTFFGPIPFIMFFFFTRIASKNFAVSAKFSPDHRFFSHQDLAHEIVRGEKTKPREIIDLAIVPP